MLQEWLLGATGQSLRSGLQVRSGSLEVPCLGFVPVHAGCLLAEVAEAVLVAQRFAGAAAIADGMLQMATWEDLPAGSGQSGSGNQGLEARAATSEAKGSSNLTAAEGAPLPGLQRCVLGQTGTSLVVGLVG